VSPAGFEATDAYRAFPGMGLITPVEWWDNLSLRCPRSVMVDLRGR